MYTYIHVLIGGPTLFPGPTLFWVPTLFLVPTLSAGRIPKPCLQLKGIYPNHRINMELVGILSALFAAEMDLKRLSNQYWARWYPRALFMAESDVSKSWNQYGPRWKGISQNHEINMVLVGMPWPSLWLEGTFRYHRPNMDFLKS